MSSPVFTSEELRVVAMNTSTRRGKFVARRRLIWRWFAWFMWRIFLPVIGSATVLAGIIALLAYAYFGRETAYNSAQTWAQKQMGPFKNASPTMSSPLVYSAPDRANNTSMIPLTDEATPDLQLDRHLTIKIIPVAAGQK